MDFLFILFVVFLGIIAATLLLGLVSFLFVGFSVYRFFKWLFGGNV